MEHTGGCHCGNIAITFSTKIAPDRIRPVACQCAFCRKHNVLAVADPEGHLEIRIGDKAEVNRYRFGLGTAEYLICRICGVYVAAITVDEPERALVVVNSLDSRDSFTADPVAANYDNETEAERRARRRKSWTPVTLDWQATTGSRSANLLRVTEGNSPK
ncbi:GFA family protein [Hoeflea poritis]|uniref:CENP-V/GFA domain-containing protein n=1 Tax=Hoeflea poritis TaxID=2993659 RepID=A0ABT4VQM3_9HYPH|nr:hypothetical protein [Hoeflea poritis]MDA4847009.1 hypothetical protein [Hoeflea poritis]